MRLTNDTFSSQCRAQTKKGKRCTKRAQWLIPFVVSRESWLNALKSGWPRCVRGMKSPEYRDLGFCRQHGGSHYDIINSDKPKRIYGWGKVAKVKLGADYEEAIKIGDDAVRASGFNV